MIGPGDSAVDVWRVEAAHRAVAGGQLDSAPPPSLWQELRTTDDASRFLGAAPPGPGEDLRLTVMFCDLVGSTALSGRQGNELYRALVGRYKAVCREIIEDTYGGHILSIKGDGLLAVFGYPIAHDDGARRAVAAGLEIVEAMRELSRAAEHDVGESMSARVAMNRGQVYIDTVEDEAYGWTANVASRVHELAAPGTVLISRPVLDLVGADFELEAQRAAKVKGVDEPIDTWRVVSEQAPRTRRAVRRTSLVGRRGVFEQLEAAWKEGPLSILLTGDPGIGKTAVADAFVALLGLDVDEVVRLAGSAVHAATALHPLRDLVEGRCGIGRDTDGADRLALLHRHLERRGQGELVAPLGAVLGLDVSGEDASPPAIGRARREAILQAAVQYLCAGGGRRLELIVADDLQWFDDTTIGLLGAIASLTDRPSLLMTSRDPNGRGIPAARITLDPLTDDEVGELIDELDPSGSVPRDDLIARCDGVPLFLEELVRSALIVPDDVPGTAATNVGQAVPDALYDSLLARLDRRDGCRSVAAAAAVVGRTFDRDSLVAALGDEAIDLDAVLARLRDDGVIEAVRGSHEVHRFRHVLVRDVADELLPASVRRAAHGRVAEALRAGAADDSADWVLLASHFEQAGRPWQAVDCYERAADQARRLGELGLTVDRLGRAIELVRTVPLDATRDVREIGLRLARAFAQVSISGNASPEAAIDYNECLALANDLGRSDDIVRALIPIWSHYASRGDIGRATDVATILRNLVVSGREWFVVENDAAFGMLAWFSGRFGESRRLLEQARAGLDRRGADDRVAASWFLPNDPQTSIHTHLALARLMTGDIAGAEVEFATGGEVATGLPFPQGRFSELYNDAYRSWALTHLGQFDDAAALAAHSLSLAREHGFELWEMAATTQLATIGVHRRVRAGIGVRAGTEVAELGGQAMLWRMLDLGVFLPPVLTSLAVAQAEAGDVGAARRGIAESLEIATASGVHFYDAESRRAAALLEPDVDAVVAGLEAAYAVAVEQEATVFALRIAADLGRLDPVRAQPLLHEVLDRFDDRSSCPELVVARSLAGVPSASA